RKDGRTLSVDLRKYQLTGDLSCNPFLLDGDVIFVPTEEEEVGRVAISGALKSPDEFEFVPGDCIQDMIAMAHGFATDADSNAIELVRFKENSSQTTRMNLSLDASNMSTRQATLEFPLQPDDRLYVRRLFKFHIDSNIEVVGEVLYPGEYDIVEGMTFLTDIIERAGGFTANASLKNAHVIRQRQEDVDDPEYERLKKMNISDMTEDEREYFKVKSRELVGGMGINFIALFEKNDTSQDVLLRDRDLVYIPAQEKTVKLTGQVVYPGLYSYRPGMTLNYYLKEAGGYNWNARKSKVRIIKANTGEWVKPNGDTIVEVGDTIFVPEKPERDWWATTREIITAFAQLATVYIVVERAGNL
ncbi:SLBB domain-containing protein, partial [candidate division KSB1 bacterium]|nr:SLBB domain-containing protein [candidate division KSB1 bacterium]